MNFFISSSEISNTIIAKLKTFLQIPVSTADATAVNPKSITKFLANCLITLTIIGKLTFPNASRSIPRNPLYCIIAYNCVFDNFMLADELF